MLANFPTSSLPGPLPSAAGRSYSASQALVRQHSLQQSMRNSSNVQLSRPGREQTLMQSVFQPPGDLVLRVSTILVNFCQAVCKT